MILAVLGMVALVQAGGFTHTYNDAGSVGGDGSADEAIYWQYVEFTSAMVPCVIDSLVVSCNTNVVDSTGYFRLALYNISKTAVLDSTAELSISTTSDTWVAGVAQERAVITAAGHYPIAIWGKGHTGFDIEANFEVVTDSSYFIMVSQGYGAWPTLTESNEQANYSLLVYATYRKGDVIIDGTTDVEDAEIYLGALGAGQNNNYGGTATTINVEQKNNDWHRAAIRCQNVSTRVGTSKSIDACTLWIHTNTVPNSGDVSAYRIFKPWNEGALDGTDPADAAEGEGVITWNDWSNDDEEWTSAGCASADDGGSDNSGDGTGADRKETAEASVTVSAAATWYGIHISATLAQGWYAGTINEEGVLLVMDANNDDINFRPSEYSSNQPYWSFYTSDAAVGARPSRERRPIRGVARGVIP
jgi:hypothetical protein